MGDASSTGEQVRFVFDHYIDQSPYDVTLGVVSVAVDEPTNEEFLEVTVPVSPDIPPDEHPRPFVMPTMPAYARLVAEAGLDYPLEVVAYLEGKSEPGARLPVGAVRVSTLWVREHVHGNYTLEQLLDCVIQTYQHPDNHADATDWIPEYELDWRQQEPEPADSYPAQVDYDYWTSGSVPYPGGH